MAKLGVVGDDGQRNETPQLRQQRPGIGFGSKDNHHRCRPIAQRRITSGLEAGDGKVKTVASQWTAARTQSRLIKAASVMPMLPSIV